MRGTEAPTNVTRGSGMKDEKRSMENTETSGGNILKPGKEMQVDSGWKIYKCLRKIVEAIKEDSYRKIWRRYRKIRYTGR
jgi:hypothetical protein